ncbi:MAG: hypothetical protein ACPHDL_03355 [Limisphaerales bacterium]
MTEPVDGRLGCGRLFAEEPGRIPPPMEGLEAGEVIDDLGAIDRAGGDEERLPKPPDRVVMLGRLLEVDGLGETMRLPIPPDRVVMLGRLLEVDGFGETMRLPAPLDRVVMLDRFMDGDTVLGMDRFARLLDERVILERFDSRDLSLAVVSMVDRLADGLDVIAEALGVGTERRVCSDLFAEILEDAEGEETDG